MSVHDMKNAILRSRRFAVLGKRQLAQRAQGISRDIRVHEIAIGGMSFEQQRSIARGEIGSLVAEGTAAEMQHESVLAQHVAESSGCGAHAVVVLFTIAEPERGIKESDRVDQGAADIEAEAYAGRQIRISRHHGALECPD